jgi:phage-related protein
MALGLPSPGQIASQAIGGGEQLLKDVVNGLKQFNDGLQQLMPNIDGIIKRLQPLGNALKALGKTVGDFAGFNALTTKIKSAFGSLKSAMGNVLGEFGLGFGETFKKAFPKTFPTQPQAASTPNTKAFGYLAAHAAPGTAANPFNLPPPTPKPTTAGKIGSTVGSMAGGVGKALAGLASASAALATGASAAVGAVVALGQALTLFVSKANPGVFQIFTNATDDLMAVIGQGVAPILSILTQMLRVVADTITQFAGVFGSVFGSILQSMMPIIVGFAEVLGRLAIAWGNIFAAIAPMVEALMQLEGAIISAIVPVLDILIDLVGVAMAAVFKVLAFVFQAVIAPVILLVEALGMFIKWIVNGIRKFFELIGLELPNAEGTKPGSSEGAAAKSTNIGSVDSVLQSAQKSAYSLGTASANPATKTASLLEQIKSAIENFIKELPEMLLNALRSNVPGGETAAKFADNIYDNATGKNGIAGTGIDTGSRTANAIIGLPAIGISTAIAGFKSLFK